MCEAPMDLGVKQESFAGPRALFLEGINEIRGNSFSHNRVRGMTTHTFMSDSKSNSVAARKQV
jgi:hypothetical protein